MRAKRDELDTPQPPATVGFLLLSGMALACILALGFALLTVAMLGISILESDAFAIRGALASGGCALASSLFAYTMSRAWDGKRWAIGMTALAIVVLGSLLTWGLIRWFWVAVWNADDDTSAALRLGLVFAIITTPALSVWAVTGLMGWARTVRAASRAARLRCSACNYDLRGNPDADACPECGARRAIQI